MVDGLRQDCGRPVRFLDNRLGGLVVAVAALAAVGGGVPALRADNDRAAASTSKPKLIDPGPPGGPPSDAVVLFDGTDLSAWIGGENWQVANGEAIVGCGHIRTKRAFGDCQLHVEWLVPADISGSGQQRGNSGVYLMKRYEIQILDSYENDTYPVGQAGAIYGRQPPLVNACRKPGKWQTFDAIFTAPRFDSAGKRLSPAYITVLHNGVLTHHHTEISEAADWKMGGDKPPAKAPLKIQDHGDPVRFRNIWVREL